jgi:transglycosylase-like protein with SLT domain
MATLALTAALVLPIHGHTVDQLEAWQDDWSARAADTQSVDLMDERRDMRGRHPWYFDPEPQVQIARNLGSSNRPPPSAGVEQWRTLVAAYFPPDHVDRMLRIMDCESGGNPWAKNPHSSATGLFQIMASWQKSWPGDYTDPWTNVAVAYQIWLTQGYAAWVCRG